MNSEPTVNNHIEDLLPLYVTHALTEEERAAADAHLSHCAACRAALDTLIQMESVMTNALANAAPGSRLEDRIVERLRNADVQTRKWIGAVRHPSVQKAAAIAAVVVLAAVGYSADGWLNGRHAGTSGRMASYAAAPENDVTRSLFDLIRGEGIVAERYITPSSVAQKWDYGDGATSSGWKLNKSVGSDYRFATDQDKVLSDTTDTLKRRVDPEGVHNLNWKISDNESHPAGPGGPATLGRQTAGNVENDRVAPSVGMKASIPDAKPGQVPAANFYFSPRRALDVSGGEGKTIVSSGGTLTITKLQEVPIAPGLVAINQPVPADAPTGVPQPTTGAPPAAPAAAGADPATAVPPVVVVVPPPLTQQQKIIRSGEMEFEVESFDKAFLTVAQVIGEEAGIIATTDSQRLPNGKVRGRIVLRVAPERLDTLVLKLRALGELKSQRLAAQDITKQYTDLQSGLRAADAMAERLLAIIKEGKGQIKDLLAAEKELGVWREKIEQITGEIRYYDNLVGLSTLTITAYEKDIKAPATTTLTENITAGVETEDVTKARAALIEMIESAKGRIIESELKQFEAGQLAAKVVAEIPPEASGSVIDRLRQLGVVTRLEAERKRTGEPGNTDANSTATPRVEQKQTTLVASLYNVANVQPRVSTSLTVGAEDVEKTYRAILDRINKAAGRIVSSGLDQNSADNVTGSIRFEIRSSDAAVVLNDVKATGVVTKLAVAENPDSANVTASKQAFTLQVVPVTSLPPRQTVNLLVQANDVPATLARLKTAAGTARVIEASQSQDGARQQARFVVDLPQDQVNALLDTARGTGKVQREESRTDSSVPDSPGVRARVDLTLASQDAIVESGSGLWPTIRQGLVTSVAGLLWSVRLIVIGLCLVAPWVLILWAVLKVVRRKSVKVTSPAL